MTARGADAMMRDDAMMRKETTAWR